MLIVGSLFKEVINDLNKIIQIHIFDLRVIA